MMMKSFEAFPDPCTTMKLVVVKDIGNKKEMANDTLRINIKFPVDFTEIKHERVCKLTSSTITSTLTTTNLS